MLGIDEAGRGPVIGPLVVAGVALENESKLITLNVRDSKKIAPKKRVALAEQIKKIAKIEYIILSAMEIDTLREKFTLNEIEAKLFAEIINKILSVGEPRTPNSERSDPSNLSNSNLSNSQLSNSELSNSELSKLPFRIYVDSADANTETFRKMIFNELRLCTQYTALSTLKIISEHKADENYPVVSAASIIAKVIRDGEIEKIKKEVGYDFGSGYPSDVRTIEYIKKIIESKKELPIYVRRTWDTVKRLIRSSEIAKF